jgi:hypothetical protein
MSSTVTDAAWDAIAGGYDLQVHVAPDVIARRIDDLDLAKEFLGHGLKGFVLKSHYFPTAERAAVVTKAVPGISAYGALTLNHSGNRHQSAAYHGHRRRREGHRSGADLSGAHRQARHDSGDRASGP